MNHKQSFYSSFILHPSSFRPHRTRGGNNRSGFTLIEMVLVLAVLLVMFSVVWPSLDRLYSEHHIRQGAEGLQVRLAAARVHAMEDGVSYCFHFEPGGRHFVLLPAEVQEVIAAGEDEGEAALEGIGCRYLGELPEGVAFELSCGGAPLPTQILNPALLAGLPGAESLGTTAMWSIPMLFFPDGSSTGGVVEIVDKRNQTVRVATRPLTGGVSLSKVEVRSSR